MKRNLLLLAVSLIMFSILFAFISITSAGDGSSVDSPKVISNTFFTVFFNPSPDPRAVEHVVYYQNQNTGQVYGDVLPVLYDSLDFSENSIATGILWKFTATARDQYKNESVHSNAFWLYIEPDEPALDPPETPEVWRFGFNKEEAQKEMRIAHV